MNSHKIDRNSCNSTSSLFEIQIESGWRKIWHWKEIFVRLEEVNNYDQKYRISFYARLWHCITLLSLFEIGIESGWHLSQIGNRFVTWLVSNCQLLHWSFLCVDFGISRQLERKQNSRHILFDIWDSNGMRSASILFAEITSCDGTKAPFSILQCVGCSTYNSVHKWSLCNVIGYSRKHIQGIRVERSRLCFEPQRISSH